MVESEDGKGQQWISEMEDDEVKKNLNSELCLSASQRIGS